MFLFINNTYLCNSADGNILSTVGKNLDTFELELHSKFLILQK